MRGGAGALRGKDRRPFSGSQTLVPLRRRRWTTLVAAGERRPKVVGCGRGMEKSHWGHPSPCIAVPTAEIGTMCSTQRASQKEKMGRSEGEKDGALEFSPSAHQ